MSRKHGLPEDAVARIRAALASFPELQSATLFGSRAKGNFKPGSDIDLALEGALLDWRTIGRIYDTLDDLLLPYRFSLIKFDANTDPEVTGHIERVGIPFFDRRTECAARSLR